MVFVHEQGAKMSDPENNGYAIMPRIPGLANTD
jgi:hypothetical protein